MKNEWLIEDIRNQILMEYYSVNHLGVNRQGILKMIDEYGTSGIEGMIRWVMLDLFEQEPKTSHDRDNVRRNILQLEQNRQLRQEQAMKKKILAEFRYRATLSNKWKLPKRRATLLNKWKLPKHSTKSPTPVQGMRDLEEEAMRRAFLLSIFSVVMGAIAVVVALVCAFI